MNYNMAEMLLQVNRDEILLKLVPVVNMAEILL
jgi:hypothetical protein